MYYYQAENGSWLVCSQDADLSSDAVPGCKLTRDEPHSRQGVLSG